MKYRLSKRAVKWAETWLNCWAHRIVISGLKSSRRSVTSSVHQGSILETLPFSVFVHSLWDDVKPGWVFGVLGGSGAFQRIRRLEERVSGSTWSSAKANAKSCPWRGITTCTCTSCRLTSWKAVLQKSPWESQRRPRWTWDSKCSTVARRAASIMGCVRKAITRRSSGAVLPFCSALVRPYLECCPLFWACEYEIELGIVLGRV